jgi:two-component system response regulator HydG
MRALLTVVAGEGEPKVSELRPGQAFSLGRNRGNQLVLHDQHASRKHAEIVHDKGRWLIRDNGTLNGTRVNGQVITGQTVVLDDGQLIEIGKTALQFILEPTSNGMPLPAAAKPAGVGPVDDSLGSKTLLCTDELTALCRFMAAAVKATEPRALIQTALEIIHVQIAASVTGFLSLDKEDPLPKIVLPKLARVDVHLSRRLTQEAEQCRRTVWLGASESPVSSEDNSLLAFTDAICIPLCAGASPLGAVHAYKLGPAFKQRDVQFMEVLAGHLTNSLHLLRVHRTLEAENSRLRVHSQAAEDLIGTTPVLCALRDRIKRLAQRPSTVLIVGESGAGKELVALALHRHSPRHEGPLVSVNCAAIVPNLLESELFGHRKGAFSGADRDRPGLFQLADEGTLFLDEVGELSMECQAKLLRVIEGKGFRPVGADVEIEVNVRILAATNRDLHKEVETGRFRKDLFFRLQGIEIQVPPLREHIEDIPELVEFFLNKFAVEWGRRVKVTEATLRRLQEYSWPGNVRQLRAVLENAIASTEGDTLESNDIRLPTDSVIPESPSLNLEKLEAWAIRQALQQTHRNVTQAARVLGIARETLNTKMRKYEITREE